VRVLVVSDIHANFEALKRIPERYDHVLCLGDVVDYGPNPKACLEWLRERDALVIRGNHDHAVGLHIPVRCAPAAQLAAEETRAEMERLLEEADLAYLRTLPYMARVVLGGTAFQLVHATPSDPLFPYVGPAEGERWLEELSHVDADVLLVGHTHLPMVIRAGRRMVVNPGSVGQPRDGDPRAAYAIVEDGEPRVERVDYDIGRSLAQLASLALSTSTFRQLSNLLRTGRPSAPRPHAARKANRSGRS
jgi:putative phosphoesterase